MLEPLLAPIQPLKMGSSARGAAWIKSEVASSRTEILKEPYGVDAWPKSNPIPHIFPLF